MQKLDAVNTLLPFLGESPTDSVDSRNPVVGVLLDALFQHTSELTAEGLWFNRSTAQLHPDGTGRIQVPKGTLTVYSSECPITIRGDYLWQQRAGTDMFEQVITVDLVQQLDFEDLPAYAAQCCMYGAGAQVYLQEYGADATYQHLMQMQLRARQFLMQEHLRNRRYVLQGARTNRWKHWRRR